MTATPMTGSTLDSKALQDLAAAIRSYDGLTSKAAIGLVSEVLGGSDWLSGPGDDGAAAAFGDSFVIACGEALSPPFVKHDPYGAGIAAVLTNINDLAAMGARPMGIVNTIVADDDIARQILRGIRYGCELYGVSVLGGHLTRHAGEPALSAFGLGRTDNPLSITRVQPGQQVILGAAIEGEMRTDFPFFRAFEQRADRSRGDVELLAELADSGACVAAKDVSMAGVIGSLAMLLEHGNFGVDVDLDRMPRPAQVDWDRWLRCFPSFAFLMTSPPDRVDECIDAFESRDLAAAAIGQINKSGKITLNSQGNQALAIDLTSQRITGLS